MTSSRRPIFTQNASSHSMAQTTKPAISSQPQPSDSTNLTQLSTLSLVPVTTSALAATKSPPNAALPSVGTQKRVICSNTRLSYLLPLRLVRLSPFQSNHFASLTLRHSQNHEQHASLPQFQTPLLSTATRVSSLQKLASPPRPSQALHAPSNSNPSYGRHGQASVC